MSSEQTCLIIGASHGGVNAAFALRKNGWKGAIHLYDSDPALPYHRPPLSKGYLKGTDTIEQNILKSAAAYEEANIELHLGQNVEAIDPEARSIQLSGGENIAYDQLILACGARPLVPPIPGLKDNERVFTLRTAADAQSIREAFAASSQKRVVVIGGGYIGLETAAALRQLGATVQILEREERILSRVTSTEMAQFFTELHQSKGVDILTGKEVSSIESKDSAAKVICSDQSVYLADLVILGVGVRVNTVLARQAGLRIDNGIQVNAHCQTSDSNIYAIGDCTSFYHPHYQRQLRLESVQNALDQARVAAANICGQVESYTAIPWFWSDQYDIKLQIVGLSQGYTKAIVRKEKESQAFSVWYFRESELLAVDAVNNARAYLLGGKIIQSRKVMDQKKLIDPDLPLKPSTLLIK
jgi:3-phenylpropionate/trans-cinnamate dioxygenase ferredoxin reductase subunit